MVCHWVLECHQMATLELRPTEFPLDLELIQMAHQLLCHQLWLQMVLFLDLEFHQMETLEVHLTEYHWARESTQMDLLFPIPRQ